MSVKPRRALKGVGFSWLVDVFGRNTLAPRVGDEPSYRSRTAANQRSIAGDILRMRAGRCSAPDRPSRRDRCKAALPQAGRHRGRSDWKEQVKGGAALAGRRYPDRSAKVLHRAGSDGEPE